MTMIQKEEKITILFIGANYNRQKVVRTEKEYKAIKETISSLPYRNLIQLIDCFATKRHEIRTKIIKYKPQIIHFSGHGSFNTGPIFDDDDDEIKVHDLQLDLIEKLKDYKKFIKVIVFNICESSTIAEKTSKFIDYTVGTDEATDDDSAIAFTKGFYENWGNRDEIKNSIKAGNDKYASKYFKQYNERRKPYYLYNEESIESGYLESLLGKTYWENFLTKFNPNLRGYVGWALILASILKQDSIELFVSLFGEFLEKFLKIKFNKKNIDQITNEINKEVSRKIIFLIIENLIDSNKTQFIEEERIFTELTQVLEDIEMIYKDDPIFCISIFRDYLSKEVKNFDQHKSLSSNLKEEDIDWNKQIHSLLESANKALYFYRAFNQNETYKFPNEDLLKYCKQQLDLTDLASQFGYRYEKDLFEKDPELAIKFQDFFRKMEDTTSKERVFLLLGHMGLGKTWNASYIAYEYINKNIPVFFFPLGGSYQTKFNNILGGFIQEGEELTISQFFKDEEGEDRKIGIIFDGFDELPPLERQEFMSDLCDYIKEGENSKHLMILLTSRLVDWINTPSVNKNARKYREFIFQNKFAKFFDDISIHTGASFILEDIEDEERLIQINQKYQIEYNKIKDLQIRKLLQKPFIIRIIAKTKLDLYEGTFDPNSDIWFNLFAKYEKEDTILRRMGITDEVEGIFQELICEIADPYSPVPEDDLIDFIEKNKYNWNVIFSSGIIYRKKKNLQNEYHFKKEYQGFIERYITDLKADFHQNLISKADARSLEKIEKNLRKQQNNLILTNITDREELQRDKGYVCDINGRVIGLYLTNLKLKYVPIGVEKLIGLQKLNLQNNGIEKIPYSIGRLHNLKTLNLSANKIIKLPNSLNNLKNLKRLNLKSNKIESIDLRGFDWRLHFLNISDNINYEGINQKDIKHSIDYVSDSLELIDDEIKKDTLYKIKDAVVIDYLNQLVRGQSIKSFEDKLNINHRIKSITIKNPIDLKEIFWLLEELEFLELEDRSIKFEENNKIRALRIIDTLGSKNKTSLELDESIYKLKSLETLYIEGFHELFLPESLKSCSNLKQIIIFSNYISKFPQVLLELENFPNVIINTKLSLHDIDTLTKDFDTDHSQMIVKLAESIDIPNLILGSHIQKLCLVHSIKFPQEITFNGILRKVLITRGNNLSINFLNNLNFWSNTENGNLYLGYIKSGCLLPNLINNFENLTHLRINHTTLTQLPEWVLKSPNIKHFLITVDDLPTSLENFHDISNDGIFVIKVSNMPKMPDIPVNMKNLTHFFINQPHLNMLPEFIGQLTQTKRLIITPDKLNELNETFGKKETKYLFKFRVSPGCRLPESIGNLKNLTKLRIRLEHLMDLPHSFGKLNQIKQLYITSERINESPEIQKLREKELYFELRTNLNCNLPESLANLNKLTHLQIEKLDKNIPFNFINGLTNLTYLGIISPGLNKFPDFIENLPKIKQVDICSKPISLFKSENWEEDGIGRFELIIHNQGINAQGRVRNLRFKFKYFKNITHLRFSGNRIIDFIPKDYDLKNLTHFRLDDSRKIPDFIRSLNNVPLMELDARNISSLPQWFSEFSHIQQLIITPRVIPFSNFFWNHNIINTLRIQVSPGQIFPVFIKEYNNLNGIWLELPNPRNLPRNFEDIIKNFKELKIYTNIEIRESFDDFLNDIEGNIFVIKLHPLCNIPESLKKYVVQI